MTDFAIAPTQAFQTMPQRMARVVTEWVKRHSAIRPVSREVCPAASELAGITRIDRFDIAPWLSF